VRKAAPVMLPLRSLGWDVALTPDGPLLIEVNHDYDIFLSQTLVAAIARRRSDERSSIVGRALLLRGQRLRRRVCSLEPLGKRG